jgi:hypothetical protein
MQDESENSLWQKCRSPFFPRRTVDGGWTSHVGQTWRRTGPDGKWQYKQDPETWEEWDRRQY